MARGQFDRSKKWRDAVSKKLKGRTRPPEMRAALHATRTVGHKDRERQDWIDEYEKYLRRILVLEELEAAEDTGIAVS